MLVWLPLDRIFSSIRSIWEWLTNDNFVSFLYFPTRGTTALTSNDSYLLQPLANFSCPSDVCNVSLYVARQRVRGRLLPSYLLSWCFCVFVCHSFILYVRRILDVASSQQYCVLCTPVLLHDWTSDTPSVILSKLAKIIPQNLAFSYIFSSLRECPSLTSVRDDVSCYRRLFY